MNDELAKYLASVSALHICSPARSSKETKLAHKAKQPGFLADIFNGARTCRLQLNSYAVQLIWRMSKG